MRDTLDLQELRDRVDHYKSESRKRRNRAIIWTIGLLIIGGWLLVQSSTPISIAYMQIDGEWIPTSFDTAPVKQFVSSPDNDKLWLETHNEKLLFDLNNDWREVSTSNLDGCCFELIGAVGESKSFVLALNGQAVAFYNGSKWSYQDNYLPTETVVDYAFTEYVHSAIDVTGDIYLLDAEEEWFIANAPHDSDNIPEVVEFDNELYLIQDGIWMYMYYDMVWELHHPLVGEALYLGRDTTSIWLVDGSKLIAYDPVNDIIETVAIAELGLPTNTSFRHVFTDEEKTYLVTSTSVIRIDDRSWASIEMPDTTPHGITTVGILNGLWIVGSTDLDLMSQGWLETTTQTFLRTIAPLLMIVLMLLALTIWLVPVIKAFTSRLDRTKKLISAIFPDMPVYERVEPKELKFRDIPVTSFVGLIFLFGLTFITFPLNGMDIDTSHLLPIIFILSMVTVVPFVLGRMYYKANSRKDDASREHNQQTLNGLVGLIVLAMCFVGAGFVFSESLLVPYVESSLARLMITIVALFLIIVAIFVYFINNSSKTLPLSFREGNYPEAIQVLEQQAQGRFNSSTAQLHLGVAHLLFAQHQEAYDVLLRSLRDHQNSMTALMVIHLVNLGAALERMGQLDRAMVVFEAAIAIMPESPISYLGLVNSYNNRREFPNRALELSNEMMSRLPDKPNRMVISHVSESQLYAIHALALAQAGHHDDARPYIEKMYDHADEAFVPYYTGFIHQHGMVKAARGDLDGAVKLLYQALELDPVGENANHIKKDLAYIASLQS